MIAIEADAAFNLVLFLETDRAYLLCVFHNESTGGYARCIAPTGGVFPIVADITETSPNAATALDAEVYLVPGGEWMLTVYAQASSTDLDETSATARELIYTTQVQVDRDSDEELVATPPGGGGVGTVPDADGCRYIRVCGTPTDGQVVTWNEDENKYEPATPSGGPGGGVSDHGALTGLGDDDHTQYHNNARGDARYYTQGQVDTALGGKANTSHTHAIADTTGLQAALDGKQAAGSYAAASHSHAISDVTGLQTAIDGKAAADHSHDISDVTGLQTALDAKATTASLSTLIGEDPGAGVGIIESGAGVTPYVLKNIKDGNGTTVTNNTGSLQIDIGNGAISNAMLANGAVANLSGINTGDQDLSGLAVKSANLSDLTSASTARTNLGLGTLATQSGTFSGTSSGMNTGDQDLSSYATTAAVAAAYEPKSKNVKVNNFTFNSATYTNLTGASVSLDANTMYQVRVIVSYTTPATGTGIGVSLTLTGSPTDRTFTRFQPNAATGTIAAQIAADDAGVINSGSTSTTPLTAILDGNVLTSGSASTIQVRVARGGTSNTITILSATIIAHPI